MSFSVEFEQWFIRVLSTIGKKLQSHEMIASYVAGTVTTLIVGGRQKEFVEKGTMTDTSGIKHRVLQEVTTKNYYVLDENNTLHQY